MLRFQNTPICQTNLGKGLSLASLWLQTSKKVDLVGKAIFHFGSHKKGGGCDFYIPVQNVKFHSELKVLPDGNVIIAYCHNRVSHSTSHFSLAQRLATKEFET